MKTFLKWTGILLAVIVTLGACGTLYVVKAYPKVSPAENIQIKYTPERLARGKYLVQNVVGCLGCHSHRDFGAFSLPIVAGTEGMGGFVLDKKLMGLPGTLVTRNITPYKLKDWTDGELIRTLRAGVNKEGKALFPLMPYTHYRELCQEDLYSIVTFIRTLKPIAGDPPPTQLDFPVNLIVRTIPADAGPFPPAPDRKDKLPYGKYLVNACSCTECHTPRDSHGEPLPGLDLAGGMEFHLPDGSTLRPANITPDKKTGIGDWTKDYFVKRFRLGKTMAKTHALVKPGEVTSIMPWEEYGGMNDQDLGAIFEYLHQSVKPVEHNVEKFTPATFAKK